MHWNHGVYTSHCMQMHTQKGLCIVRCLSVWLRFWPGIRRTGNIMPGRALGTRLQWSLAMGTKICQELQAGRWISFGKTWWCLLDSFTHASTSTLVSFPKPSLNKAWEQVYHTPPAKKQSHTISCTPVMQHVYINAAIKLNERGETVQWYWLLSAVKRVPTPILQLSRGATIGTVPRNSWWVLKHAKLVCRLQQVTNELPLDSEDVGAGGRLLQVQWDLTSWECLYTPIGDIHSKGMMS